MSETIQCIPVNNVENFVSQDLLVPTSRDVVSLNRFLLEMNLDNSSLIHA
jgi:hypothetical protein